MAQFCTCGRCCQCRRPGHEGAEAIEVPLSCEKGTIVDAPRLAQLAQFGPPPDTETQPPYTRTQLGRRGTLLSRPQLGDTGDSVCQGAFNVCEAALVRVTYGHMMIYSNRTLQL